jgi:ribonucleotide reductase alpha subunit
MTLDELKALGEAPDWMDEPGFATISGGYMLPGETPRAMYRRVALAASRRETTEVWYEKYFDIMWRGWLCPASPVLSNMGTDRGLPISCNSIHVGDSVNSIFTKNHELAMLSKHGAGVGIYVGDIRGRGTAINGNGASEGVIPWCKTYDTTTSSVSQGATRRGASAVFLPIDHSDINEFLNIRRPTGDMNRRCLNLNHGVVISNEWMQSMIAGDHDKREVWKKILKNRVETGEPYLMFVDNANDQNPGCYRKHGLSVKTTNICCVSGDTKVLTTEGIRRIDELPGESVKIWDGRQWVDNDTFKLRGYDQLTRVTIKDGSYVDCNAEHRWFTARNYNDIRTGKYREKLTRDLVVGDFVEAHDQQVHGPASVKAAYLKGFLTGDGTHLGDRPVLSVHSVKYACIEALVSSGAELEPMLRTNAVEDIGFGPEHDHTGEGALGTQVYRTMYGIGARKSELFPWTTEYRESLPEEVFSWDRQSKLLYLSGLLDADGTVAKDSCSIQLSSIHLNFITTLRDLLKTLGVSCSIDRNVRAYDAARLSGKPTHRLTISSWDGYHLLQELSCSRIKYTGKAPNRKTTGWRKIVKIEALEGTHPVYCPTLPTTGKFALANGLMTGNTEIYLHTDPDHTFVCCLSSMNLVKLEEWRNTDAVRVAIRFLDAVMQEYIEKTEGKVGFDAARRSAIKGRPLGLGVLGWHTLLQQRGVAFDSFEAMMSNARIFSHIRAEAENETRALAEEFGEPEWCKGTGRRHTHLMAVAPTFSNAIISGGHSQGIEPLISNIYAHKTAKGTFIRKNPTLEGVLADMGKNTADVWKSINEKEGSVQHLDFLSDDQKAVFMTAREINQHAIVKQAAQRQAWVDQGQSVNLFFAANSSPKYIHEVHLAAWEQGLKSLYYLRTSGVIRGDLASRSKEECAACEG